MVLQFENVPNVRGTTPTQQHKIGRYRGDSSPTLPITSLQVVKVHKLWLVGVPTHNLPRLDWRVDQLKSLNNRAIGYDQGVTTETECTVHFTNTISEFVYVSYEQELFLLWYVHKKRLSK